MNIGVPKEIKNHEYRVGLTPSCARELIEKGHLVFIETNAGAAIGYLDDQYKAVGCFIEKSAIDIYSKASLIIKIKEPQPAEFHLLNKNHTIFTYLHLAADLNQAQALIKSQAVCIAYETVTDSFGRLPLLAPMSAVAGRLSIQIGAHFLQKNQGGKGIILGGIPGTPQGKVLILGGGVVGYHATQMALGLGASIQIIDKNIERLNELDKIFSGKIQTLFSKKETIEQSLAEADLVIGAALIPGAEAPHLVTKKMLSLMQSKSVIVDVAIDQGGCFETSRPTTHQDPIYIVDDIIHYCVTNMPSAAARTATQALTNATLPFIIELAEKGPEHAMLNNKNLLNGLNIYKGFVTNSAVANSLNLPFKESLIAINSF